MSSHDLGATRGSETTLNQVDVEKQANHGENASDNSHNVDAPRDAEKQVQETDAETGPSAPAPINPMMDPASFPDGGLQAWLCVLGAAAALFVSFGWINCIGVFQNYYQTHELSHLSPSTIAWIPSLEACVMFLGGSWVGRLYDNYGPRYLLLIGSLLHVFGLMMASISTKYYQFLLAQGICSPIGASMVFYPVFSCVVTWFFRKRALAIGLAASGSSLGGVLFPIMVQRLVNEVGFPWTMRICAFLILGLLVLTNLLVKSRIPPHPRPVKFIDFVSPLKERPFGLLTLGMFLYFFGLFLPFTFIILAATEKGMGVVLAGYLVSILNATSIFGRTVPAYFADTYFGRFNTLIVMAIITTILVLAMWIPASSNAVIILFAAFFGFTSGTLVSMAPALVAQISPIKEIGVRTGTIFTIVAIAVLVGNPIGGSLVSNDNGHFLKLQIFAGCMMAAGSVVLVMARIALSGFKWKVKV